MHIIFCANDAYVDEVLTCVSYISKTQKDYTLHILGDSLTDDNITRLEDNDISVVQFNTITLRRLDRLWDIDITDYYAGCVKNIITPKAYTAKHYCEFGIPENTDIANLGVMAINCKRWREHSITSKLIQFTIDVLTKLQPRYSSSISLARIQKEEFSFNSLLIGKWLELEEKWNVVPVSKVSKPYIIHTWHDPSTIYK